MRATSIPSPQETLPGGDLGQDLKDSDPQHPIIHEMATKKSPSWPVPIHLSCPLPLPPKSCPGPLTSPSSTAELPGF